MSTFQFTDFSRGKPVVKPNLHGKQEFWIFRRVTLRFAKTLSRAQNFCFGKKSSVLSCMRVNIVILCKLVEAFQN